MHLTPRTLPARLRGRNIPASFAFLLLFSGFLAFSRDAYAAAEMTVPANGTGVYEVTADAARSNTGKGNHNVVLTTADNAVLTVNFPNGMDWQVGGRSRVFLESFLYNGPTVDTEPMRTQWKKGGVKDVVIAGEKSNSSWTARLEEGELFISSLFPEPDSIHIVNTPEARFDLKVAAAMIRRSAAEGTVINVFNGTARVIRPDGTAVDAPAGTKLTISPSGQVTRSTIEPGAWVWLPPPPRPAAFREFVVMPIDVTIASTVSPSS